MAFWAPIAASVAGNVASNLASSLFGGGDSGFSVGDAQKAAAVQHHANINDALTRPRAMVMGANRAGIHPAMLFGGSAMSTPSWSIGSNTSPRAGQDFSAMGQDISRAVMAKLTANERAAELEALQRRQALEDTMRMEQHRSNMATDSVQRQLIASQIKRLETNGLTPPMPSNTSANVEITPYNPNKQTGTQTGKWELQPSKVTSADPVVQSLEAGPPQPGFKRMRVGGPNIGGTIELPGQGMSESLEAMGPIAAPAYVWGHNLFRSADTLLYGDPRTKPKGYKGVDWEWNRWKQKWIAKQKGGK